MRYNKTGKTSLKRLRIKERIKKESPDPELETTIPGTSTNPETSSSDPSSHETFCFEDSSPEPSHLEYFNFGVPNPEESRGKASSRKVSHSRSLF